MSVTEQLPTYRQPVDAPAPETSGVAIAALVLAILLSGVPVLGQLVALVFAWQVPTGVDRSGGQLRGREVARAARLVSVTFLVVWLLALAVAAGIALRMAKG